MKSPLDSGPWVAFDEVRSTQDVGEAWVQGEIEGPLPGVIYAHEQTHGRGRFDRVWLSQPGDSLTMSLIFKDYANHPRPWLIGMAVALAAAGCLHCQVQWPNDLVIQKRKLAGILTNVVDSPTLGLVPVVGVGINLNQKSFPAEIASFATSFYVERGHVSDPETVAKDIIARLANLPEPNEWSDLADVWALFDDTPGKRYVLPTGEAAVAIAVGPDGQLLCAVEGETRQVMAADAFFLPPRSNHRPPASGR